MGIYLEPAPCELRMWESAGEALFAAAARNDVEALRSLIEGGADLNDKDCRGRTPLWVDVDNVARDAISFLEERGAREW